MFKGRLMNCWNNFAVLNLLQLEGFRSNPWLWFEALLPYKHFWGFSKDLEGWEQRSAWQLPTQQPGSQRGRWTEEFCDSSVLAWLMITLNLPGQLIPAQRRTRKGRRQLRRMGPAGAARRRQGAAAPRGRGGGRREPSGAFGSLRETAPPSPSGVTENGGIRAFWIFNGWRLSKLLNSLL